MTDIDMEPSPDHGDSEVSGEMDDDDEELNAEENLPKPPLRSDSSTLSCLLLLLSFPDDYFDAYGV